MYVFLKCIMVFKRARSATPSGTRGRKYLRTPSTARSRSRSRGRSSSRSTTPLRRILRGRSFSRSRSTNRLVGHSAHSGESAISTRLPMAHTRFVKRVAFKRKLKIKVSKNLKQKIQKVIEKGHAHGSYKEFYYTNVLNNVTNGQVVKPLLNFTSDAILGIHFDPVRVLNAASILWHNKTTGAGIKTPAVTDVGNFDTNGLTILARDLHTRVTLRNNSQRVYICKIYECAPKSVIDPPAAADAPTFWTSALAQEFVSPFGSIASVNPLNNSVNQLYMTPQQCKQFNQQFASQVTNVTIEPGQSYVYFMQGPQNMVYDYTKFYQQAIFANLQKMTRHLFIVAHNDLITYTDTGIVGGGNPGVARLREAAAFVGAGLAVEVENVYKLGMPKKTGGYIGAAIVPNAPLDLEFAHDVHAQVVHADTAGATPLPIRVDEENPIQPQAPV
ncbi:capsid protein [Ninurtavirus muliumi]|uniref:Capsid protein n=1 Tax=Blackfly DNA Virus 15 TaxID=2586178 RepID=A0A4Y5QL20_9VIRU|nr:capsid protein [Blackfly DNA Virus 15]